MLGHNQVHGMIRKYIIVFGSLFDDITIPRINQAGNVVQNISVPIAYGPKEKWLTRISQDPSLNKYIDVTLPRIGFEVQALTYDPLRKLSTTQKNVATIDGNNNNMISQYVPVPYNMDIMLSVFTRNANDGAQIIEQILPYFTPDFTVSVNTMPDLGIVQDIPVVLTSVTNEDVYDGDFEMRRSLVWNLTFTMKGYLYGPSKRAGIIKRVMVDSILVPGSDPVVSTDIGQYGRQDRVVVQPGLTASGDPTNIIEDSLPYSSIHEDDPYGFAQDITLYTDGKKYDPRTGSDVEITE